VNGNRGAGRAANPVRFLRHRLAATPPREQQRPPSFMTALHVWALSTTSPPCSRAAGLRGESC
jgi:hypothetical protein